MQTRSPSFPSPSTTTTDARMNGTSRIQPFQGPSHAGCTGVPTSQYRDLAPSLHQAQEISPLLCDAPLHSSEDSDIEPEEVVLQYSSQAHMVLTINRAQRYTYRWPHHHHLGMVSHVATTRLYATATPMAILGPLRGAPPESLSGFMPHLRNLETHPLSHSIQGFRTSTRHRGSGGWY